MKNILIVVFAMAVSFGVYAKDQAVLNEDDQAICQMLSEYATFVMTMRQGGADINFHLNRLNKSELRDNVMNPWFRDIVYMAYEKPIVKTSEDKKIAVKNFTDQYYKGCVEGMLSATAEAN